MLFENAEILICILLKKMLNKFEVAWLFYKYSEFETLNIGKKKTWCRYNMFKCVLVYIRQEKRIQYCNISFVERDGKNNFIIISVG
jgi:hypothetical protein